MTSGDGLVFLFSDVEASTRLWESFPTVMPGVLAEHDGLIRSAVEATDGKVFKHTGDGILAVFPAPASAVGAALTAQRALGSLEVQDGVPLRVRMAIHQGEAEAREDDYFGPALNRCARLLDTGWGGQILVSGAAEEDLSGVDLLDLGDHVLKDLSTPVHVYQVLAGDLPSDFPPLRSLSTFTHNLPIQLTAFFGREREIAELSARLDGNRLVTLFGPGGVGKSRLALQIASESLDRYRDGVWLVEFATVSTGDEVAGAVAQVLRLPDVSGRDPSAAVIGATRHRNALLLLDNCEHVVDSASALVDEIVSGGGGTDVLATSRQALGVRGEFVHPVRPLSMEEERHTDTVWLTEHPAIALFTDRARAVRPGWRMSADSLPAVAQICQSLDGIPLAIEIAAGRLRTLEPEEIAARLDDRFRLLTGGHRTALARHQTLKGAIDWSYDLLEPAEKTLLQRLAIFAGRFDMEAAEQVCNDAELVAADVLDVLTRLVERSLVTRLEAKQGRAGFRLLETIRQYALDLLAKAGAVEKLRERHAIYYKELAQRLAPSLRGPDQIATADRMELDLDNLRAAVEWSLEHHEAEQALELATATFWMWQVRGWFVEPLSWLRRALNRATETSAVLRVTGLAQMSMYATQLDEYEQANRAIEDGLRVLQGAEYPKGEAWLLHNRAFLSMVAATGGESADDDLNRARQLAVSSGDGILEAEVTYLVGRGFLFRGENERAVAVLTDAHRLATQAGDSWLIAWSMLFLAAATRDEDPTRAVQYLDTAAPIVKSLGDLSAKGLLAESRGYLAIRRGDTAKAVEQLERALQLTLDTGSPADQIEVLMTIALLLSVTGDPRAPLLVGLLRNEAVGMGFALEDRTQYISEEVMAGVGEMLPQTEVVVGAGMDGLIDLANRALAEANEPSSAG